MKNIDRLYQCHVFGQETDIWQLQCHLRIIYQQFGQQIVIVSPQNCEIGWFIESKTTKLATQIVREFHLNPESLVWIEHDPHYANRPIGTEYSEVRFEWHQAIAFNPQWHPISNEELELMIGNQWLTGSLENQLALTKEEILRKMVNV
ncbi:hypothetical protein [Pseudanabaena yagii]|uniref:Uncharacterized protein n=1 Tax=Pseudanabaena yagii GIHE-NHR1 TaxID=2722753 RepID=A0ABX1LUR0_9CYAN|nr:hypothetical protein [Pseudanabaena yagii]NMF59008.1 hypothetical protein [Pseudanabaena yagii GIHE-NHR1]